VCYAAALVTALAAERMAEREHRETRAVAWRKARIILAGKTIRKA